MRPKNRNLRGAPMTWATALNAFRQIQLVFLGRGSAVNKFTALMAFLLVIGLTVPTPTLASDEGWPRSVFAKKSKVKAKAKSKARAKAKAKRTAARRAALRRKAAEKRRRARLAAKAAAQRATETAAQRATGAGSAATSAETAPAPGIAPALPTRNAPMAKTADGANQKRPAKLAALNVDAPAGPQSKVPAKAKAQGKPKRLPTGKAARQDNPAAPNRTSRPWGEVQSPPRIAEAPPPPVKAWQWRITKTEWSRTDEEGFEEFVRQIGESRCRSVNSCLKSAKANPAFHASNPRRMFFYADCADLPYMLRAYYAWKKGLPFSYSSAVSPLGRSRDIRYSLRGNAVSKRIDLVNAPMDARRVIPKIMHISSAAYRIPPLHKGRKPSDHYSVEITRRAIKPGTIIYDPNGHVVVVYKVTREGRIHYIDSHPDNSLTRGVYGRKFQRARASMSAGFKRWRPLKLVDAVKRRDGSYSGGRIVHLNDEQIADWSVEQFYGTGAKRPKHWRSARFTARGKRVGYYDFVRLRLAAANFKFNPIDETRSLMQALCEDIKYRVDAVDAAIAAGIHKRPQPYKLPLNIYGTEGDWETYSSPSRDARLKTSFKELRDEMARFIKLAKNGSRQISYQGENLKRDLRQVYDSEAAACRISYKASNGDMRELGFNDVAARLFKLSFDPYHCIERRWGATNPAELATCKDGATKRKWYAAEQRLRNQIDRKYDLRMDFDLAGLRKAKPGSGVDAPPNIDVTDLLVVNDQQSLADANEPARVATQN